MVRISTSKKILIGAGIVLIGLVVIIAALPALLGGTGASIIRSTIAPHIEGDVTVERVQLRWFGNQELTRIAIADPNGRQAVDAHGTLHHGLLALIFKRPETLELSLAGVLQGELREDGSISFQDLVREDPARPPDEPFGLEGVPGLAITLEPTSLELLISATNNVMLLRDASGTLDYQPGRSLTMELRGNTESAGQSGTLIVTARADNLFDRDGRFTPRGASIESSIELASLALRAAEYDGVLHMLKVDVQADDLAEHLRATMHVDAMLRTLAGETEPREEASRLDGVVEVTSLFEDGGAFSFAMENLRGEAAGERVPSALLQPIFAATPLVLTRDVGPTVDLDAQFSAGDTISTTLFVKGRDAELHLDAALDVERNAWRGDRLRLLMPRAHPVFVEGYTGLRVDRPIDLMIHLTRFALPPVDPVKDARPMREYSVRGALEVKQPVILSLPGEQIAGGERTAQRPPMEVELGMLHMTFDSARLGDGIHLIADATISGAQVRFDQHITNLFDEDGAINAEWAMAEGQFRVNGLPANRLAQFAAEYDAILTESLGASIDLTLVTEREGDSLQGRLDVASANSHIALTAVRHVDALEIKQASIRATLTPRMLEVLQMERELPASLHESAVVTVDLPHAVRLPRVGPWQYDVGLSEIRLQIGSPALALADVPYLTEPITLRELRADVSIVRSSPLRIEASGTTELVRTQRNQKVLDADFSVAMSHEAPTQSAGGEEAPAFGDVTFSLDTRNIAVVSLESLLGIKDNRLTALIGPTGGSSVRGRLQPERQSVVGNVQFEQLTGSIDAALDAQRLHVGAADVALIVIPAWIEPFLNQVVGDSSDPAAGLPERVVVRSDIPVSLKVNAFDLPRSGHGGAAFDLHRARVDAQVEMGTLDMRIGDDLRSRIHNATIELTSERLGSDFQFNMSGRTRDRVRGEDQDGTLMLTGTVRDLIREGDGAIEWGKARYMLDGTVENAPTVLVDALLNLRGYLLAAIGPGITSSIRARDFSEDSGTIELDITTTYGWMRAEGEGRDGVLMITDRKPIRAELEINPLMRERLLPMLHPMLGDIVVSRAPMELDIRNARIPLDGDVSRLNADILLMLGTVELDPRSPMFRVLALAETATDTSLTSTFEPIVARIRDGVVTYDRFIANVAGVEMPYEGRIDLNDQSVSLRTEVPFVAIARRVLPGDVRDLPFAQFSEAFGDVSVPIVTTGKIGAMETRADPQFDMGKLVQQILQRSLQDQLESRLRDLPIPFPFPNPRRD